MIERPSASAPQNAPESGRKRHFLIGLFLLTIVMPFSFHLGSLHLTASLVVLTLSMPVFLVQLLAGSYGRVTMPDLFMLLFMGWRTLETFIVTPSIAIENSGSNLAIILGAYLLARATIRTAEDFSVFCKILILLIIASFPLAFYEARTSQMLIPRLLDAIPGIVTANDANYDLRHGFYRVQVVFSHPIHYGLFCAFGFALLFTGFRHRLALLPRTAGAFIIALSCFLSGSSGPFFGLLFQAALTGYGLTLGRIRHAWSALMGAFLALYLVLELLSNRPALYVISSKMAFDPSTAYDRKLIFDAGVAQMQKTPVFGMGMLNQLDLPERMRGSIDNYWIGMGAIYGIPALVFLIAVFLSLAFGLGRRRFSNGSAIEDMRLAWLYVLVGLMLTISTVFVWEELASLTFFFLGSGVFFLDAREGDGLPAQGASPPGRTPISYTRFTPGPTGRRSQPDLRRR